MRHDEVVHEVAVRIFLPADGKIQNTARVQFTVKVLERFAGIGRVVGRCIGGSDQPVTGLEGG